MKRIEAVVDRIEGHHAVLVTEEGRVFDWPVHELDEDVREQDVLEITVARSEVKTQRRREEMKALHERVSGR